MHSKYPKLWKSVFWFAAFFVGIDFISTPFSNPTPIDIVMLVFNAIVLFPLYGFAYQVAIGSKLISIIILILNIPIFVFGAYGAFNYLYLKPSIGQFILTVIVCGLIVLFCYPMYAYAFKSDKLWEENA